MNLFRAMLVCFVLLLIVLNVYTLVMRERESDKIVEKELSMYPDLIYQRDMSNQSYNALVLAVDSVCQDKTVDSIFELECSIFNNIPEEVESCQSWVDRAVLVILVLILGVLAIIGVITLTIASFPNKKRTEDL